MIEKILSAFQSYRTPIVTALISIGAFGCFWYGAHVERLEANEEIALMEKEYATRESSALWEAECIRKQQEQAYLAEMDRLRGINADISADALRVREQFNQLQGRRSTDLERCNNRAQRCEQLLSEAYDLARESEVLLRERDARLNAVK